MYRAILSFVSVLAVACSKVDNISTVETAGLDPNSPLLISIVEDVDSRGELVEFVSNMSSIGVYCARTGDKKLSEDTIFDKMDNRLFNITDDGECVIDGEPVSWGYEMTNDMYTFFAYSPFNDANNGISPRIVDGELLIDYTVPSLCANQPDMMYSEPLKDIFPIITGSVPLSFKHSLTAISFGVQGSDKSKISRLS